MQTAEAWNTGRPIYSRLPGINGGYTDNEPADFLTNYWDSFLVGLKGTVDDFPRQLDPLNCDPDYLDYLAPLCGWTGRYWDESWPVGAKRQLLNRSYDFIWIDKGSREVLSFVLSALEIQHFIQVTGDFLVGSSEVGDPIGVIPWDYTIYLPERYRLRSEQRLVEKINYLFGPCWCVSRIVFEDERFVFQTLLATDDSEAVTTDADEALEVEGNG